MCCPSVRHGLKEGPNRKVHNYFELQIDMAYSKRRLFRNFFFRFDPRQEVQIKLSVPAEGFISSLAKLTMRLVSR
jgi:hypothetical protein